MSTDTLFSPLGFDGGFTVLMAVYHREDPDRFKSALLSVFNNSLVPDAVILVVDGPLPNSLVHVICDAQLRYDRLQVHHLSKNMGLAAALNAGLSLVKTAWVVRADSDDFNRPYRFAYQAAAIEAAASPIDLIGGAIQEIDLDGTHIAVRRTVESDAEIRCFAKRRNPFNHMTVSYRTALALKVGGYPDILFKEDYALWASMLSAGAHSFNLPDILVDAVTGKDMYRRRGGVKYALAEYSLQKHLVRCRIKNFPEALFDGAARSAVFLVPAWLRVYIYKLALRT